MNQEYGPELQFEILAAYVREPERFHNIVEPQFFGTLHVDVARVVAENREQHPKDDISEDVLLALLNREFHKPKDRGRRKACRKLAHKIFKHRLRSLDTVEELARGFVVERMHRKALIDAEEEINRGRYDGPRKIFEKLATKLSSGTDTPHLLHTKEDFMEARELSFSIEGFLQNGAATLIGGLSGHGKTWVMFSMAKALLSGEPLWGYFKVPKRAKRVLYLIPESTIAPVKHRLQRMGLLKYVKDGRLLVHTMSAGPKPKLDDPQLLAVAKRSHIFLDTAIRFGSGEENSADANQKGLATDIFALLSAGARTVIGAHHSAKAFDRANFMTLENVLRGSGDIGAMAATVWGIKQVDSTRNILHIENVKPRDFEPCKPFQIIGRPYIDKDGDFRMLKKPGTCGPLISEQSQKGGAPVEQRESRNRNIEAVRAILDEEPQMKSKDVVKRLKKQGIHVAETTVRKYKQAFRDSAERCGTRNGC